MKRRTFIIASTFYFIIIAFIIFGCKFFFKTIEVQGISMNPTYYEGDKLLVQTKFKTIKRNDVIKKAAPIY